jgi:glycine/D-amino acid oxidase-like deaminating enzyme
MSVPGKSNDVIIIGGGFIGAATAYYLARRGTSVLLIEGKSISSGSTGACAGRAQVSECHPGLHLDLVQMGLGRLEHLQEELDYDFEWRRFGNVMLVDSEHYWQEWATQSALLAARSIPAEMWDAKTLKEAEPAVRTDDLLGAAWCLEGHVNPHKYCWAYARAARRCGAEIHTQEPVISIERQGQRITGVRTSQGV